MAVVKGRPDQLPGLFETRVFIGGQYDFMPTLRRIAQYVEDVTPPGETFNTIIPYDYDIEEHETMDWDLAILGQCKYAIFDLSDLGAQLVEMQEAKQKKTMIRSLLVYPVRDRNRRHDPERGKRTIYSFGLPFFGYVEFEELRDIVGRFLHGGPTGEDWAPRKINDINLERHLRFIRLYRGRRQFKKALEYLENECETVSQTSERVPLELLLEQGLNSRSRLKQIGDDINAASVLGNTVAAERLTSEKQSLRKKDQESWANAKKVAQSDRDRAEYLYYISLSRDDNRYTDKNLSDIKQAAQLCPEDGRFGHLLSYLKWFSAYKANAVNATCLKEVIADSIIALGTQISDPVTDITARNNLAYYYCELAALSSGAEQGEYVSKALDYSEGLDSYHDVFSRQHGFWLDTRALARLRQAEYLLTQIESNSGGQKEPIRRALREATELSRRAAQLDPGDDDIKAHMLQIEWISEQVGL